MTTQYPYLNDLERQSIQREFTSVSSTGRVATKAFADEIAKGTINWMEAFAVTDGKWVVLKKEKSAAEPDTVGQIVVSRDLGFFAAMHALAQFETSRRTDGVPEVETPPHTHYKDVAIRMGLAFDVNGMPHPTIGGQIVGDSFFPDDVYTRAEDYAKNRRTAAFGPAQKLVQAPDFFRGKVYFEETQTLRNLADDMTRIKRILESLLSDGSGYRAILYGARESKLCEVLESSITNIRTKTAKLVATNAMTEAFAPDVLNWLSQAVTAQGYYARVSMAQKIMHDEKPALGSNEAAFLTKTIQKAATDIAQLTGAAPDDALKATQLKVMDFKLERYAWRHDTPREVSTLIEWVGSLCDDLTERSKQAAQSSTVKPQATKRTAPPHLGIVW